MEDNTTAAPPTTAPKNNMIPFVIALVIILAVGAYFLTKAKKTADTTMQKEEAPTTMPTKEATGDAMKKVEGTNAEVTVEGSNFKFVPATLTVKKGTKVKLVFKNSGGFHDINIDELNVHSQKINDGASDTVTFTPDKTGTFEYYCSVGQHRQMGMVGKITVE